MLNKLRIVLAWAEIKLYLWHCSIIAEFYIYKVS